MLINNIVTSVIEEYNDFEGVTSDNIPLPQLYINPNIFSSSYDYDSPFTNELLPEQDYYQISGHDCEWIEKYNGNLGFNHHNLTSQVRAITNPMSAIFTHKGVDIECSHPFLAEMKRLGLIAEIDETVPPFIQYANIVSEYTFEIIPLDVLAPEYKSLPRYIYVACGHFLAVDNYAVFHYQSENKNFSDRINTFINEKVTDKTIDLKRCFSTGNWQGKGFKKQYKKYLDIDGVGLLCTHKETGETHIRRLSIQGNDTVAIARNLSYVAIAEMTNYILPYKKLVSDTEKGAMDKLLKESPLRFVLYAHGDTFSYEIRKKFDNELIRKFYSDLGMKARYKPCKDTFGSTVSQIVTDYICTKLNIDIKQLTELLSNQTKEVKIYTRSTACHCGSTFGGRAFSNDGLLVTMGEGIDIDIKGAYGTKQTEDNFGFCLSFHGPEVYAPSVKSVSVIPDINYHEKYHKNHVTVEDFLKVHEKEFLPNKVLLIISNPNLSIPQDLLPSKHSQQIVKEGTTTYIKERTGTTDVYSYALVNTPIDYTIHCHLKDDKEMFAEYKKSIVIAAQWYSAKNKVNTLDELYAKEREQQGKENIIKYWYEFPLNSFTSHINALRDCYRELSKLSGGEKHPMDELCKSIVNMLYGILCSTYFIISDPTMSNSITSTVRGLVSTSEKVHNGIKTVTDGHAIDLNRRYKSRKGDRKLTLSNNVGLNYLTDTELHEKQVTKYSYKGGNWVNHKQGNIEGVMDLKSGEFISNKELEKILVDEIKKVYGHLPYFTLNRKIGIATNEVTDIFLTEINGVKKYLKTETIKGILGLEIKRQFSQASYRGKADYQMIDSFNGKITTKYRSYKDKGYHTINPETLEITPCDSPAFIFASGIMFNPSHLKRSDIVVKTVIVSPKFYSKNKEKLDCLRYKVGSIYPSVMYLLEYSHSNFQFQNPKQRESLSKERQKSLDEHGQYVEGLFINSDGTLNYELMILVCSKLIRERGLKGEYISKLIPTIIKRKLNISSMSDHPKFDLLKQYKKQMMKPWLDVKPNTLVTPSLKGQLFGFDLNFTEDNENNDYIETDIDDNELFSTSDFE